MDILQEKIVPVLKKGCLAGLATTTADGLPWVRYVSLVAKSDFPLLFGTDTHSRKVEHIRSKAEVHLVCGNLDPPDDSVYMQIQARASLSTDPENKKRYWNPEWTRYFSGPDDPRYVLVELEPYRVEWYGPDSFKPLVWEKSPITGSSDGPNEQT